MQGYVRKRRRSWAETCPRWAIPIASLAQERKTVGVPCTGAGSHTDQSEAVPSIEQRSARSQRSWRVGRTDALSFYSALSDRSFLFLFFIPPPLIPNCSNAFSVITKNVATLFTVPAGLLGFFSASGSEEKTPYGVKSLYKTRSSLDHEGP